ncbi:MAG: excisionase [Formivibrio sp.]|nr:excisionase [Formivibrio sp.]
MSQKQPAWITLDVWAENEYGDKAPNMDTLRKWARSGLIMPTPEKVGATWFVRRESRYTPLPKRGPSMHHTALPASNESALPSKGSRLVDRVRAAGR